MINLKPISYKDVEDLLNLQFNKKILLNRNNHYYQINRINFTLINHSTSKQSKLCNSELKNNMYGSTILKYNKRRLIIFPSIMYTLFEEVGIVKISNQKVSKVSFGKRIHLNQKDSICLLLDKYNRKIAFGCVENNIFTPFIDVGWYLRHGN